MGASTFLHLPPSLDTYNIISATTIAAAMPHKTGIRFFLAKVCGSMLHIAATGITAQGIMVPPSTHTVITCPSAASPAILISIMLENVYARVPTIGSPEKPEPSRPVITATADCVKIVESLFI